MKRAACVIACGVLIVAMFLLVQRALLVALLAAAVPWLTVTAVRRPARLGRACATACLLAMVLTAVPVDVWILHTGTFAIGVDPVIWGLWMPRPGDPPQRGLGA